MLDNATTDLARDQASLRNGRDVSLVMKFGRDAAVTRACSVGLTHLTPARPTGSQLGLCLSKWPCPYWAVSFAQGGQRAPLLSSCALDTPT